MARFEFAVSAGEGTLLEYGVREQLDGIKGTGVVDVFYSDWGGECLFEPEATVILGPAGEDCVTGE